MLRTKEKMQSVLPALMLLAAVILIPYTLFGQRFTGEVTDHSGAVVPKATVTVHNQETNVDTMTKATSAGTYAVPYLTPGLYTVSAEAPGFKKAARTDITLEAGKTAVIDLRLDVGTMSETIVVKGDTELLDSGKADRGEVVENARVTELPINGRTVWMLATLQAGARFTGSPQYVRPFDHDVWRFLQINGGGQSHNEALLDGVSNETTPETAQSNSRLAYIPPDDAVQEFKVVTAPYDAQYGRLRGGAIDMTLKTGTNKLHGDVYEFMRRTWLDANTFKNNNTLSTLPPGAPNRSSYQRAEHKLDQYGFELDGPIVIPHVYNGKNKAFFVLQYEYWNEIQPRTITTSVPDPAWLQGDFSSLRIANGTPIPIYDPLTTQADGTRLQFPGNKIPKDRLDPVALRLLSYYPAPNITPAPGSNPWQNNWYVPNPTTDRYRNVLGKFDYNLSDKDRLGIRYGYNIRIERSSNNGVPGPAGTGYNPLGDRMHSFVPQWTHTFSPNLLFDFRAAAGVRGKPDFRTQQSFDQTQFWPASMVSQLGGSNSDHFPAIGLNGFTGLGSNGNTLTVSNSLSLMPTVTWIRNKHTIRAGTDVRWMQYGIKLVNSGVNLSFNEGWTSAKWNQTVGNTGNSVASMLLGTASGGTVTIDSTTFLSYHYYAPFIQDDWRVSKKLTLNLGLRWDFNMPGTERHDHGLYAFDTNSVNPVDGQINHALMPNNSQVTGGVRYLGANGNPRTLYSPSWLDIQPRVGFAYSLDNKTVLRGGAGEFFQNPLPGANTLGWKGVTNYTGTLDGGMTPRMNLANPFPTIIQPTGSSLGMLTGLGMGLSYSNPHYQVPNVWQFSFGVQRQLDKNSTLEVSYVGNQSHNNNTGDNINVQSSAFISRCNIATGGNPGICTTQVPNPFYNVPAFKGTTYYSAPTINPADLTRPFPAFGDITQYENNGGSSWYNALEVTATRKAKNLTLHGTWTWSKLMNAGGWADNTYQIPNRKIDGSDVTHRFTISGVYTMPVGRGRKLLGNAPRILDAAIGGWELGAMSRIESGQPWGAPGGFYYVGNASVPKTTMPNGDIRMVAPCVWAYSTDPNTKQLVLGPIKAYNDFGCTAPNFIQRANYAPGQNVLYTGIRQPRGFWLDTNMAKHFPIRENVRLQLRLEGFNVVNHPLFQNGFYTSLDEKFGTIGRVSGGGQSNLPRQLQIAAKLIW
jgi:hypothetical protein